MKVIDLLNKIANGEEVPKEIEYTREHYYLTNNQDIDNFGSAIGMFNLNDEIEIIEDTPKEENKIPKKINQNNFEWEYVYSKKSNEEIINNLNILRFKYNEIIDYLKSKGE